MKLDGWVHGNLLFSRLSSMDKIFPNKVENILNRMKNNECLYHSIVVEIVPGKLYITLFTLIKKIKIAQIPCPPPQFFCSSSKRFIHFSPRFGAERSLWSYPWCWPVLTSADRGDLGGKGGDKAAWNER